jgi:hypothetical protein
VAGVAPDDDVGTLVSELGAAAFPKEPEKILAGHAFVKARTTARYVKPIDRCGRYRARSTAPSKRRLPAAAATRESGA